MTEKLLEKLYTMGILATKKNLDQCTKLTVSAFARCVRELWVWWATSRVQRDQRRHTVRQPGA